MSEWIICGFVLFWLPKNRIAVLFVFFFYIMNLLGFVALDRLSSKVQGQEIFRF